MTFTNVLSIVLVALSELSLGKDCPLGWTGFGNKCYMDSTEKLSWMKALKKCENEMATLACITDSSINNYLWRNDGKMKWIGLQTTGDKSKWYWNTGMPYSNSSGFQWYAGEPQSGEVCARLKHDDTIAGQRCSYSDYYFICQAESDKGSWYQAGQYWFYFSNERGNYYVASKNCSDMGGYLAREEAVDALDSGMRNLDREYWLGLSRWYWIDGSQYIWYNFISSESNIDGTGKCYVLHGNQNKWEPRACTDTNHYICQKDKGSTTAATSTMTSPTTTTTELATSPKTTKQTTTKTSTMTTTTTTTATTPAIITPPPQPSTTTMVTPIETSSLTMASGTGNESVSDFVVNSTSPGQTTVVASSGEAKGLFDTDSALLYTLIVICALIIVLVVTIIVLLILSRRRVNKQSDKERLHTDDVDGENQQMAQLPGPSSQSTVHMNRHVNTTYDGNTATEQTSSTASDGVPIYAVPNKKMTQLPGPSSQSTAQMNRHANTTHGGNAATEQTSPTASDGVPIYAVVNKKKAQTEQL